MTNSEYTKGFLAGMTWAEERIIKLLEAEKYPYPPDHKPTMLDDIIGIDEVIELIKGETK